MSGESVMPEGLRERIRLSQAMDRTRSLLKDEPNYRDRGVVRMAAELVGEERGIDPKVIEGRILEGHREAERHLSDPSRYIKGPLTVEEVDPRDLGFKVDADRGR